MWPICDLLLHIEQILLYFMIPWKLSSLDEMYPKHYIELMNLVDVLVESDII